MCFKIVYCKLPAPIMWCFVICFDNALQQRVRIHCVKGTNLGICQSYKMTPTNRSVSVVQIFCGSTDLPGDYTQKRAYRGHEDAACSSCRLLLVTL